MAVERGARARARRRAAPALRPQRGALAIMFSLTLVVLIGFLGMALDLAQIYNRKAELQGVADAAAMAAAGALDGTTSGLANALTKARNVAATFHYQYNLETVALSDAAITFSNSAGSDAVWLDKDGADPANVYFVRVETDAALGLVNTAFMGALAAGLATVTTAGRAVAGSPTAKVTPLAICALSPLAKQARTHAATVIELVEYGFRRGVGYDLLNLNPGASTPEHFVVNPLDAPGSVGALANTAYDAVAPFVCSGSMPLRALVGSQISVRRPFPIANLYQQLNARFNQYAGTACNVNTAPPDANVKPYNAEAFTAGTYWMANQAALYGHPGASAHAVAGVSLKTVADHTLADMAETITAGNYGPLWSYSAAAVYAASEPSGGYVSFARTAANWATLYPVDSGPAVGSVSANYPTGIILRPYLSTGGNNFLAPATNPGQRQRRALHIPLLACPLAAGSGNMLATVLAIGKFFMTVPATATSISAEFAGVVKEQTARGPVELYQ